MRTLTDTNRMKVGNRLTSTNSSVVRQKVQISDSGRSMISADGKHRYRMSEDGRRIDLADANGKRTASAIGTPNAIDAQTAWKFCEAHAPGALQVYGPTPGNQVFVNIDRGQSIKNNEQAGSPIDRIDIIRHQAMKFFGR